MFVFYINLDKNNERTCMFRTARTNNRTVVAKCVIRAARPLIIMMIIATGVIAWEPDCVRYSMHKPVDIGAQLNVDRTERCYNLSMYSRGH